MYYCNYFRFENPEEFDDLNDIYEPKTMNTPFYCPYYRQFFSPQQSPPFGQMGRQPDGEQPSGGAPSGPPPSVTPSKQSAMVKSVPGTMAVESGSLKPCLFKYVYIWPRRGEPFWAWLTYIGRKSVSGYRWERHRWVYFGIDLKQIDSFTCY